MKTTLAFILVVELLFYPLAVSAAISPEAAPATFAVTNDESQARSDDAPIHSGTTVEDSGASARNTDGVNVKGSTPEPSQSTSKIVALESNANESEPELADEQSSVKNETPILDSVVDAQLLAQSNPTDTPILREGVSMSDEEVEKKIDDLTKQIILKEIELERFGINYNQQVAKQGRWKGWRYGLFQEANSSLGLAGGIVSVYNRGLHLDNPTGVHRILQENANTIPMIGSIIGAGAAGLEFGINEYHMVQAYRKGYSAGKSCKNVLALRNEIESMLAQRAKMISTEVSMSRLADRVEIDQAEEQVLKDMLDQNLQQFERFHIAKRRLFAFQQMQYGFDAFKYTTNAIGCRLAWISLNRRQRVYNGWAGILFAVSGGLTMVGPVVSRVYAKAVSEHHRHLLRPATQTAENATLAKLKADHVLLDKAVQNSKSVPEKVEVAVQRSSLYASGEKTFEDAITSSEKARDRAKLTATQNIGAGAYVGVSKLASGILFIYPGFNHRYNRNTGLTASRGTNNNLFAAGVIGLPSSTFSILDTLRINILGEITRQQQIKKGTLPSQLAQARLKQLDELEARLKADAKM
ncbi:MAG: hypothetical protein K2X93_09090 [Candidatus Obscuribacterales bacterium]|nr:hypothetical protein [Candidatus Obscuribacterales bacterium]